VEIRAGFTRAGFQAESTWLFHADHPWIDITYRLQDGWTDNPQTVEFCFPFALENPTYRYDAPGAILRAGPKRAGGDDLPGANPELYAGLTFATATAGNRTALVLGPDALLWRFGGDGHARIASMPMMNLTGNDHQFGQGGWRDWTFRYRIVLLDTDFDPTQAIQEAQQFATAPFLQAPDQMPAVSGLESLDIDFAAGPLLAFKTAEDGRRLILRFWNVTDRPAAGSLKLPPGWPRAELCDALERPKKPLDVTNRRVHFTADPHAIVTVALLNDH
jgi:glycosyl hydrolase family 38